MSGGRDPPTDRTAPTEFDLHALVDGQLPHDRRQMVMAALARDPDTVARVADWQFQKLALQALFHAGPDAGADPGWRREVRRMAAARVPAAPSWHAGGKAGWLLGLVLAGGSGAAAAALVAVLLLAGPTPVTGPMPERLSVAAAVAPVAEPARMMPVGLVASGGIDLSELGWRSVEVMPAARADGPVQTVYRRGASGPTLRLVVGPPHPGAVPSFAYLREGQRVLFRWSDGAMAFTLVGQVGRAEMLAAAEAVHAQLSRRGRFLAPQPVRQPNPEPPT